MRASAERNSRVGMKAEGQRQLATPPRVSYSPSTTNQCNTNSDATNDDEEKNKESSDDNDDGQSECSEDTQMLMKRIMAGTNSSSLGSGSKQLSATQPYQHQIAPYDACSTPPCAGPRFNDKTEKSELVITNENAPRGEKQRGAHDDYDDDDGGRMVEKPSMHEKEEDLALYCIGRANRTDEGNDDDKSESEAHSFRSTTNGDDGAGDQSSVDTATLMRRLTSPAESAASKPKVQDGASDVVSTAVPSRQIDPTPPTNLPLVESKECVPPPPAAGALEEYTLPELPDDDSSLSSVDHDADVAHTTKRDASNHGTAALSYDQNNVGKDESVTAHPQRCMDQVSTKLQPKRSPQTKFYNHDYAVSQSQPFVAPTTTTTTVRAQNEKQNHSQPFRDSTYQTSSTGTVPQHSRHDISTHANVARTARHMDCSATQSLSRPRTNPYTTKPRTTGQAEATSVELPATEQPRNAVEPSQSDNENARTSICADVEDSPSMSWINDEQLGEVAFMGTTEHPTTENDPEHEIVDLTTADVDPSAHEAPTGAGRVRKGLRSPPKTLHIGRLRTSIQQHRDQVFGEEQDEIDQFSDNDDADGWAFGFSPTKRHHPSQEVRGSAFAPGDNPFEQVHDNEPLTGARTSYHAQYDKSSSNHNRIAAIATFESRQLPAHMPVYPPQQEQQQLQQLSSNTTVAMEQQCDSRARPRTLPLPEEWSSKPKRRKLRNPALSDTAFVAAAVVRRNSHAPTREIPVEDSSTPRAPVASDNWMAPQLLQVSGGTLPPQRNDLRGGSGVGAGQYQLVNTYHDEQENVWEDPPSLPSSRGRGRGGRGRGRKGGGGGGWRSKGRGRGGGRRGRGGPTSGRGRGNGTSSFGRSSVGNAWSDYGPASRWTSQSTNDGSKLGNVGGAEITF